MSTTSGFDLIEHYTRVCKDYSTINYILTIDQVLENCGDDKPSLYISFIDRDEAFESFQASALKRELHYQVVEESRLKILQDI